MPSAHYQQRFVREAGRCPNRQEVCPFHSSGGRRCYAAIAAAAALIVSLCLFWRFAELPVADDCPFASSSSPPSPPSLWPLLLSTDSSSSSGTGQVDAPRSGRLSSHGHSRERETDRVLQQPADDPCAPWSYDQTVLLERPTCKVIVKHQSLLSPLQNSPDTTCSSLMRNIVLHPDAGVFFFIFEERCDTDNRTAMQSQVSIHQGNLHVAGGEAPRICYWWSSTELDGPRPNNTVCRDYDCYRLMDYPSGMVLSKSGSELLLCGSLQDYPGTSWLTALRIADGSKSSTRLPIESAEGLSWDPGMATLFMSASTTPPTSISSADVTLDANGTFANRTLSLSKAVQFESHLGFNISKPYFGPQSFTSDGKCLYFIDRAAPSEVWAFHPSSQNATLVAGSRSLSSTRLAPAERANATSSSRSSADVDGLQASFGELLDIAVVGDGHHLFASESRTGRILWIEMDSPCTRARRVTEIAKYLRHEPTGVSGLAVQVDGQIVNLTVGVDDGQIFRLSLNTSVPFSPPAPDPPPPSSRSPSDSFPASPSVPQSSPDPDTEARRRKGKKVGQIVGSVVAALVVFLLFLFCVRARDVNGNPGTKRLVKGAKDVTSDSSPVESELRPPEGRPAEVRSAEVRSKWLILERLFGPRGDNGVNDDDADSRDDEDNGDDGDDNGDVNHWNQKTGDGDNDGDNQTLKSVQSPQNGDSDSDHGDDDDDDEDNADQNLWNQKTGDGDNDGDNQTLKSVQSPQNGDSDSDHGDDDDDDEDNADQNLWNQKTGEEEREDENAGLGGTVFHWDKKRCYARRMDVKDSKDIKASGEKEGEENSVEKARRWEGRRQCRRRDWGIPCSATHSTT
ncbi:hypothetical protein CBR_g52572 [Chara braunii]|uniref:Uncharacterized protein n=1 Tax=Chara braunii TaxID=69332 RepID=A0A388MAE1_CHABU|nr:hypothetical protein CBR_g52572 [Chara braunii]|eukprot:GBG91538.1 hypothetical protein CBR_g52572 [Chara braunii]